MDTKGKILIVCTTDSMIWNFLIPHIQHLQKEGFQVECACSETGGFFRDLETICGFSMHRINFKRSPYSFSNIQAYYNLKRLVKLYKYDVVFCHEPVGGAMGRLVGKSCNCKVVYMAHGFHFYDGAPKSKKIYYYIERWLSKYTDILITINKEDYEAAQKFRAGKVVFINGVGIDITKFNRERNVDYIRDELNLSKNAIILLSVGELIPRKNHAEVIEALKLLNDKAIHYVIVGDGELAEYLTNIVKKYGLVNNVHLLGYRRDINQLCNSADIFVMPSIHEGLSVALMEAMACGLPIIASKIRGNVDLVDDYKGGLLVNNSNVNEYSKSINMLSKNGKLRIEMGLYNAEKIKSYDIDSVLKQMNQLWSEIEL